MLQQMTLTSSQSKRLIARGVARYEPVVEKMTDGMIVIAKGSTNRYVAEELLGESLARYRFAWGLVAPPGISKGKEDIPEIVLVDGARKDMPIEEAVESLSAGDIFIKGGNALEYQSRSVGILSSSLVGGTIGFALPKIIGSRVRLLIPIGLEKCVVTPIGRICSVVNSPDVRGRLETVYEVHGDVFTEIEALETLLGVEAIHIASGGVSGYEGAVRLAVAADRKSVEKLGQLEDSIRDEPQYLP
jgi:hypothetical protein